MCGAGGWCDECEQAVVWLAWMGLCCVLAVARKNGGHFIDPSQELIALGIVNLFSSVLYGFPVTGEQ